jgi:hypothetical protein
VYEFTAIGAAMTDAAENRTIVTAEASVLEMSVISPSRGQEAQETKGNEHTTIASQLPLHLRSRAMQPIAGGHFTGPPRQGKALVLCNWRIFKSEKSPRLDG